MRIPMDQEKDHGRFADIYKLIDGVLQQVRSVSYLLHPPCSTKSDFARPWVGMWTDSQNAAESRLPWKHSRRFPPARAGTGNHAISRHSGSFDECFPALEGEQGGVMLERKAGKITVSIQDDGIGIPEKYRSFARIASVSESEECGNASRN